MEHFIWLSMCFVFVGVYLSKILAHKTKTVDVLWFIVIGAILGNFELIEETESLEFLGNIGIILVMFALGWEEDAGHFVEGMKKAWGIATIGAIFPFGAGYYSALSFGYSHNSALIWGLTMTATAVSLTMMTLKSLRLHKTEAATGIMTSAVVDDVLSLIGVAILLPIILAGGDSDTVQIDYIELVFTFAKVIIFFIIVYLMGKFILPHEKGLKRIFNLEHGTYAVLGIFVLVFWFGALAHMLGFHPAIGAYFAGLLLKEEHFELRPEDAVDMKTIENIINNLAFVVFGPVFFILLGSKIIFDMSILSEVIIPTLGLFFAILVSQILSAGGAAKFTGGYNNRDSILIGLGMLGRAELAFIVINIAYVQNSLISQSEFYILVFTTFLLNISVPLLIKGYTPFYKKMKS
jgi:Kef-type K+ transport system membrane component KefB